MSNFHCFASRIFESLGRVQLFYVPQAFLLFLLFNIQKKMLYAFFSRFFRRRSPDRPENDKFDISAVNDYYEL